MNGLASSSKNAALRLVAARAARTDAAGRRRASVSDRGRCPGSGTGEREVVLTRPLLTVQPQPCACERSARKALGHHVAPSSAEHRSKHSVWAPTSRVLAEPRAPLRSGGWGDSSTSAISSGRHRYPPNRVTTAPPPRPGTRGVLPQVRTPSPPCGALVAALKGDALARSPPSTVRTHGRDRGLPGRLTRSHSRSVSRGGSPLDAAIRVAAKNRTFVLTPASPILGSRHRCSGAYRRRGNRRKSR